MAYLLDDEEQKQQQQGQQPQGAEQVMTGPSSGVITPGATGTGPTQQQQAGAPKAGGNIGGFTNLQSYVTANEGNDAQMGQKVTGVVGNDVQNSDTANANFMGTAKGAVDTATVHEDKGLASQVYKDPTKVANDAKSLTAWERQTGGQYDPNGPKDASSIEGFGDAQKASDTTKADLTAAAGGNVERQGLLDKAYGRPNYSSGEKGFDSFLLGAGADGQKSLADIQTNFGSRATQFADTTAGVDKSIEAGRAESAATGAKARDLIGTMGATEDQKLSQAEAKLTSKNGGLDKGRATIQALLASNDPEQRLKGARMAASLSGTKFDRNAFQSLPQGFDFSSLFKAGTNQGLGDTLTPEQVAKYQAIGQLGFQGKFNGSSFAKTGGDGKAFTADAGRASSVNELGALMQGVDKRANDQNTQHDAAFNQLSGGLGSLNSADRAAAFKQLNIDPADAEMLAQDEQKSPLDYLKRQAHLSSADLATENERTRYDSILNYLGVAPGDRLRGSGAAQGPGYDFDKDAWAKEVEAMKYKRGQPTRNAAGTAQVNVVKKADKVTGQLGDGPDIIGKWGGTDPALYWKKHLLG